jgi:DNA-binding transcriptional LysR family regulator
MRLTLDALLVLDAIDKAGSFAAGAEHLFRVPSAVSYTIHKLEQDLGVVIFDRSKHRARLTKAGAQLLKDGRALLRMAEEVERRSKAVSAGWEASLAIAVGDVLPRTAVYPLLRAFYQVDGNASTHLHVTTEAQASCWETLLDGRADLVIGAPQPAANLDGFRTQLLGDVELTLVVPSVHPLANAGEPVSAASCSSYRFVRQEAWPFAEGDDDGRDELVMVDNYDSQLEAIRHGLGIGYAPAYLVHDDVVAGRLVTKRVTNAPRLTLTAAWRTSGAGPGLAWFVDQLADRDVRARLVSEERGLTS